jgi:PIN domain
MPEKLLFIDTNIWLDFYRSRGADLSLKLLDHVKSISDKLIVTYQIEMEFKKNRQAAILEGISELKTLSVPPRFGIFSDDEATKGIANCVADAKKHLGTLRGSLAKALREPERHDPVYKACETLFKKADQLSLLS